MRVLLVVRPALGGMRQHLINLVPGLQAEGLEVEAAGPADEPLLKELAALGCPVWDVPLSASFRPFADLQAVVRLLSLLKRRQYALVHVHGFKASLPGRVAAALSGVPVVYTVHNFVLEAAGGVTRQAYLWTERALVPLTARYVAVSAALSRDLQARAGVPPQRLTVIHNGVPPHRAASAADLASLRARLGLTGAERAVLCVARLVPEKGVDVLLKAVAALQEASRAGDPLPDVRLLVVGVGPQAEELRLLAEQLGLQDRVRFLGYCDDIHPLLDLADAVAVPSRAEGLSLFLLESMVAGRPVVASAAGGLAELVVDGETGLLAPPEDPLALASGLRRLLAEPGLAARLGEAAKERGSRFTVDAMLHRTVAVYREVVGARDRKESAHGNE